MKFAWLSGLWVVSGAGAMPRVEPAEAVVAGAVTEVLPADRYCYFRLSSDTQEPWLVIPAACPAVGQAVKARVFGWRADFASPRLGRVFPRLGFAWIEEGAK